MSSDRVLIVNADDFGLSSGVNQGVIEAHERGIVTSASLMVRWPAAGEAVEQSRCQPGLSLGLHIDLGEWIYGEGGWEPLYEVVSSEDTKGIKREVKRQIDIFQSLVGRDPTHIDSHQHVHLREPEGSIIAEIADHLGVPLRSCHPKIRYCGDFYGQTAEGSPLPDLISVEGLVGILEALPPGITELACHPAKEGDLDTMYRTERTLELKTLCDNRVGAAIDDLGIRLWSFAEAASCLTN
jgi:predicted glycoside hydrolase/deacetylase ChbG (UPF0249 family)